MQKQFLTPILFITYNKLDTSKKVLKKIKNLNPKNLIISSDGPKNEADKVSIDELRDFFDTELKGLNFTKLYNTNNKGCKNTVETSLDYSFKNYSKLIILEDDTLPSNEFFNYAEKLLEIYFDEKNINAISGYNYLSKSVSNNNHIFSKYINIWGWASWSDRWFDRIELNEKNLQDFKKQNLNEIFYSEEEKDFYIKRFEEVVYNQLDTWDLGLCFSHFFKNQICIFPKYNLVKNLGFGHNKATHTKSYFKYYIETANFRLGILQDSKYEFKFPIKSLKYDRKFYNRVILKNTIYNKVFYYFIKFLNLK